MKRNAIKFASFILAIVMTLSAFSFNAFASDGETDMNEGIAPCYVSISTTSTSISISGIKATCYAKLTAQSSMSLKIKMEIQKQKSSGYETVQTWTSTKTGNTLAVSETRNINVLSTYRLKTTFTAGSESVVRYTYP